MVTNIMYSVTVEGSHIPNNLEHTFCKVVICWLLPRSAAGGWTDSYLWVEFKCRIFLTGQNILQGIFLPEIFDCIFLDRKTQNTDAALCGNFSNYFYG